MSDLLGGDAEHVEEFLQRAAVGATVSVHEIVGSSCDTPPQKVLAPPEGMLATHTKDSARSGRATQMTTSADLSSPRGCSPGLASLARDPGSSRSWALAEWKVLGRQSWGRAVDPARIARGSRACVRHRIFPEPIRSMSSRPRSSASRRTASRLHDLLDEGSRGLLDAMDLVFPPPAELVLVVDQFEEVFALTTDEHERELFLESLRVATADPEAGFG